jgi:hypothetical protein
MKPGGVAGGSFQNRSGSQQGGSRPGSALGGAAGGRDGGERQEELQHSPAAIAISPPRLSQIGMSGGIRQRL